MTATATPKKKKLTKADATKAAAAHKREQREAALAEALTEIRTEWAKVTEAEATALDASHKLAKLLAKVSAMDHWRTTPGGFKGWAESNCPFSVQWAYRLVLMARHWAAVVAPARKKDPALSPSAAVKLARNHERERKEEADRAAGIKAKPKAAPKPSEATPIIDFAEVKRAASQAGVTQTAACKLLKSLGIIVAGGEPQPAAAVPRPTQK